MGWLTIIQFVKGLLKRVLNQDARMVLCCLDRSLFRFVLFEPCEREKHIKAGCFNVLT